MSFVSWYIRFYHVSFLRQTCYGPEFWSIRIRNYKYYINIHLENHQNFLVDLSKFANNTCTKWQLFLVSNCGQESVVWLNVSRIFHLPSGLLPLKSYLPVSNLARHGQSGIRLFQTLGGSTQPSTQFRVKSILDNDIDINLELLEELRFRDPDYFIPGNIHKFYDEWVRCRYDDVTLSPLLLPTRVSNRSHSTYWSSAWSDSHRAVFVLIPL